MRQRHLCAADEGSCTSREPLDSGKIPESTLQSGRALAIGQLHKLLAGEAGDCTVFRRACGLDRAHPGAFRRHDRRRVTLTRARRKSEQFA